MASTTSETHSATPDAQRLAELEQLWNQKFIEQPKLPTSALLTGAVSMAAGFGAVLFFLSPLRAHTWFWVCLSLGFGAVNRVLAARWYRRVVIPWDAERRATAQELAVLREKCKK